MTEIVRQNSAWSEWKLVRQIGRGSYGRVYEAIRSDFQMENRAVISALLWKFAQNAMLYTGISSRRIFLSMISAISNWGISVLPGNWKI